MVLLVHMYGQASREEGRASGGAKAVGVKINLQSRVRQLVNRWRERFYVTGRQLGSIPSNLR